MEVGEVAEMIEGIQQYTVEEVENLLKAGTVQVIDVRTEEEYADRHIPGVPLMPVQQIDDWAPTLDPAQAYVFVCRSGARSQKAAAHLQSNGFRHVANCQGGMMAWHGEVTSGMDA